MNLEAAAHLVKTAMPARIPVRQKRNVSIVQLDGSPPQNRMTVKNVKLVSTRQGNKPPVKHVKLVNTPTQLERLHVKHVLLVISPNIEV